MISYDELAPSFLYQFKADSELIKYVDQIKRGFTSHRDEIGEYVMDKKMVSAYLAVYASTNMAKLPLVLKRLPEWFKKELEDIEFVDFGCGPATFSYAFLKEFPDSFAVCVDSSILMLEQGERLLSQSFNKKKYMFSHDIPEKLSKRCLFFGHSLNEMEVDFAASEIERSEAEYVLLIEPGTKQSFEKVIELRSKMMDLGYKCHYPCFSNHKCPMVGSEVEDDWCHQYVHASHDPSVERLCQMAKLDRRNLPLISHFYAKEEIQQYEAMIVRNYEKQKFAQTFEICLERDHIKQIQTVEVPFRGMKKPQIKEIQALCSGDIIRFEVIKELEKFWRVTLNY